LTVRYKVNADQWFCWFKNLMAQGRLLQSRHQDANLNVNTNTSEFKNQ